MGVRLERSVEDKRKIWNLLPPTRKALASIRLKAVRCGVWFKELGRDERMFMELVIRVTDRVRSFVLAKLLFRIVRKLLEAMGGMQAVIGKVAYKIRDGLRLAQNLTRIALGWGNKSAAQWPEDHSFVQYLTIMCLNKPA